jgi:stage IV sporulation protein FB
MTFYIGKIPLTISPYFFLLALLIGILNSHTPIGIAIWVVVIFFSILLHELGHALTAQACGQRVSISLEALGGVTTRQGKNLSLWKEFIIVFAGPAVGLFIALCLYSFVLNKDPEVSKTALSYAIQVTFFVNFFWTAVNLLPMQPLDGGHLMRIFLEGLFGLNGVKIAYFLSFLTAALFTVFFFGIGQMLMGALFILFCVDNWRALKDILSLKEQDRNQALQKKLASAEKALYAHSYDEAVLILENLKETTKAGAIHERSRVLLANAYLFLGEKERAYQNLEEIEKKLPYADKLLLQKLAYDLGKLDKCITLGNQLFIEEPQKEIAELQAMAHAQKGDVMAVQGWKEWLKDS